MAGKTTAQHRHAILASLAKGDPAFGYFGVLGGSRWLSAAEKLVGEGVCRIVPVPSVSGGQHACIPVGTTLDVETMTIKH